jgi:hypothetical protein
MIPYLPSLQELRIDYCSEELRGRTRGWGKESEEEWPNIKHIPDIVIDRNYIQKEGRYVKGEGLTYRWYERYSKGVFSPNIHRNT